MLKRLPPLILVTISLFGLYWGFHYILHADMLHLPAMYRDFISGQLHWFFYNLPPSRFIFPDIPVYFLLHALLGNGIAALLANVWLNYFLLVILLVVNARLWFYIPRRQSLMPILLSLAILTLPGVFSYGITVGLFWPTGHAGAVLITLLTFALLRHYTSHPNRQNALLLSLCAFLVGLCDPLCLVLTMAPALIFLALQPGASRILRLQRILIFFLCVLAGSWLGDRLTPSAYLQYLHQRLPSIDWIALHAQMFLADFLRPDVLPSMIFLICGTFILVSYLRRRLIPRAPGILILSTIWLPLLAMLINGRYMDNESSRYFALCILLPLLALISWLSTHPRWPVVARFLPFILLIITLFALPRTPSWAQLTYPSFVQKLDSLAPTLGLKDGLTGYWSAKPATYFSHTGLHLYPLNPDASPFLKLGSLAWMGAPFTPPPARHYNFILIKNQDLERNHLLLLFGPPSRIERFDIGADIYVLWIYSRNLSDNLMRDSDLWRLISDRLHSYSYFLSQEDFDRTSQALIRIVEESKSLPTSVQN